MTWRKKLERVTTLLKNQEVVWNHKEDRLPLPMRRNRYSSSSLSDQFYSTPAANAYYSNLTFHSVRNDLYVFSRMKLCPSTLKSTRRSCLAYIARRVFFIVALLVLFIVLSACLIVIHLFLHVVPLCTPPKDAYEIYRNMRRNQSSYQSPLVEYYIHGRGNGHYARSVAIIERLKDAGIDVRMFIGGGKNGNFRFLQESQQSVLESQQHQRRGKVTTIVVSSLIPGLSCLHSFSVLIDRLLVDCSESIYTHRYPLLVLSDGDFPGMFRARLGSIPSVGIAHGQVFAVGKMPKYIKNSDISTKDAWEKERFLNKRASFFSNWQIGTNFVNLLTDRQSAVIARSPMRPEIEQMGNERRQRAEYVNTYGYNFKGGCQNNTKTNNSSDSPLIIEGRGFWSIEQQTLLKKLLLGNEMSHAIDVLRHVLHENKISHLTQQNLTTYRQKEQLIQWYQDHDFVMPFRRKLVICYFRDKNGGLLLNALLRSGFDVLLFEKGYHKGMNDVDDGKVKFGQQYILRGKDIDLSSFSLSSFNDTINQSHQSNFTLSPKHTFMNSRSSNHIADRHLRIRRRLHLPNSTNNKSFNRSEVIRPLSGFIQDNVMRYENLVIENNKLKEESMMISHSTINNHKEKEIHNESKRINNDLESLLNTYKTQEEHQRLKKEMSNILSKSDALIFNSYTTSNSTTSHPKQSVGQLKWIISQISKLFESDYHLKPPRILRVTDMSLFVPLLSIADGVASSAGSQLMSECIYANMPLLALYRENDGEQMLNVEMSRHRLDNERNLNYSDKIGGDILPQRNVVHGMSLEKFEEVFSFLSEKGQIEEWDDGSDSPESYENDFNNEFLKCEKKSRNDTFNNDCFHTFGSLNAEYSISSPWTHRSNRIISEAEELKFLNNSRTRKIYTTFTDYVESINLSPMSWTYYHDIFSEFMKDSDGDIKANHANTEYLSNCSDGRMHTHKNIDPFHGMLDASTVILNIIKQVLNDHS